MGCARSVVSHAKNVLGLPTRIVPNIERMVVARIEQLEEAARIPEHGGRIRAAVHDLIESVRASEEGEHIIGKSAAPVC